MEIVSILRLLWTRRLWVGLGFALAVTVGLMATYTLDSAFPPKLESRQYHVGVASINLLIDTPSSQVADLRPPIGADVLGTRASLFASLISTPSVQAMIARNAGIPVEALTTSPSATAALVPSPVAQKAPRTADRSNTYSLKITTQETLPVIGITAEAPDAKRAATLARASFEALREHLRIAAEQQRVPASRRPAVTPFGSGTAINVVRGPGPLVGLIAAMVVFGLICVGIVIGTGLARSWHEAAANEDMGRRAPDDRDLHAFPPAGSDLPPSTTSDGRSSSLRPESEAPPSTRRVSYEHDDDNELLDRPERVTSIGRRR